MGTHRPESGFSLEELVSRYSRLIRSAVGRVAGPLSEAVADDIEQAVVISLWRAMPDEQTPSYPSSYLYRAAVRETVRTMRRLHGGADSEIDEGHRDPAPDPERRAASGELGSTIRAALATLAPRRRSAVEAHLMGFDVHEVMRMQGWSYNTARNLIARGMADLRQELVRRGVHD